MTEGADPAELLGRLHRRGATLAVAESLTGGLVADAFVRVPGASAVLLGGVVAYATPLKHALLGVDAELLEREGAVHPEVARQMADGVRRTLAVEGRAADAGIGTTGVAGPDRQDGREAGTVYAAAVVGGGTPVVLEGAFAGGRAEVRAAAVDLALTALERALGPADADGAAE